MVELASTMFRVPPLSPCEGMLIEDGNLDIDGHLMEQYVHNSSSLFLIDQQRYTHYYSYYYRAKPHRAFVGLDARGKPLFVLLQELTQQEVLAVKEARDQVPYSRSLVITSRPWTPTSDAEFWIFCRLEGLSPKQQASKLHQIINIQSPGLLGSRRLLLLNTPLPSIEKEFTRLERVLTVRGYKFGLLTCLPHQTKEAEILANDEVSPDFLKFMQTIGTITTTKGHQGFSGGLDVTSGSTGEKTVFTTYKHFEIMFHVGPLLTEQDVSAEGRAQRVLRKRHIGNDVVILIFCERGARTQPIDMSSFQSHMNHVFIAVTIETLPDGSQGYSLSVASKSGCHSFIPSLPSPPVFPNEKLFVPFLLTKAINSERAAMYAPSFTDLMGKSRSEQLTETLSTIASDSIRSKLVKLQSSTTGTIGKQLARELSFRTDGDPLLKPSPLFSATNSPSAARLTSASSPRVGSYIARGERTRHASYTQGELRAAIPELKSSKKK